MAPSQKRKFEVLMYESEYRQIQAWVDKYQHLETGGDLFGLWKDDRTAVVQFVLGPGKHCRRTEVSFYQDIDYLERLGNLLTNKEGLCHIGEWHSHHRIGLTRPSRGDENTVWNNMDRYGIHRFFLFITTIEGSNLCNKRKANSSFPYDVKVRCFLFEVDSASEKTKAVLEGKINFISDEVRESPFRLKTELANVFEIGAESKNSLEDMKTFEIRGRESEETTRNKNEKKSNKETNTSCTAPQRTNETTSNKDVQEYKKTFRSTCYIVLSSNQITTVPCGYTWGLIFFVVGVPRSQCS